MDVEDSRVIEAIKLLTRMGGRGWMPSTVNAVLCDYFRIVARQANDIIDILKKDGVIRYEPGWIEVNK